MAVRMKTRKKGGKKKPAKKKPVRKKAKKKNQLGLFEGGSKPKSKSKCV